MESVREWLDERAAEDGKVLAIGHLGGDRGTGAAAQFVCEQFGLYDPW